jgi:hypothetical protein
MMAGNTTPYYTIIAVCKLAKDDYPQGAVIQYMGQSLKAYEKSFLDALVEDYPHCEIAVKCMRCYPDDKAGCTRNEALAHFNKTKHYNGWVTSYFN